MDNNNLNETPVQPAEEAKVEEVKAEEIKPQKQLLMKLYLRLRTTTIQMRLKLLQKPVPKDCQSHPLFLVFYLYYAAGGLALTLF